MWTLNYEDIKGVQGASSKTKIVKRRFQDQEDARTTPEDENCIKGAGSAAAGSRRRRGCSPRQRGGAYSWLQRPPAYPESRRDRAGTVVGADADDKSVLE
jgi:hypothetical protein